MSKPMTMKYNPGNGNEITDYADDRSCVAEAFEVNRELSGAVLADLLFLNGFRIEVEYDRSDQDAYVAHKIYLGHALKLEER